jgi:hypothetical protein
MLRSSSRGCTWTPPIERVWITLSAECGGTRLRLVEFRFSKENHRKEHAEGWIAKP